MGNIDDKFYQVVYYDRFGNRYIYCTCTNFITACEQKDLFDRHHNCPSHVRVIDKEEAFYGRSN